MSFKLINHIKLYNNINSISIKRLSTLSAINNGIKEKTSFHKRTLPSNLIALSSKDGKILFKEALAKGGMESFFALSEQFITQSEPAFCAVSSLAMVLNALNFDPKKTWKSPWRWVSEETLQCESKLVCGHSLEKYRIDGMSFSEFESLAHCHGVPIMSHRVNSKELIEDNNIKYNNFKKNIIDTCCSDNAESFIVSNFSRKTLGQTGGGHFSPIGGYHEEKNLVLVMDVARFKYPPFWVSLDVLWQAMSVYDDNSDQSRGYFILCVEDCNDESHSHTKKKINHNVHIHSIS
jgi:glutathione gamma-glutamylcysteinyltransferase